MEETEVYLSEMGRDGRKDRSGGINYMDTTVWTESLTSDGRQSSFCIIARTKEERMGQRPAAL